MEGMNAEVNNDMHEFYEKRRMSFSFSYASLKHHGSKSDSLIELKSQEVRRDVEKDSLYM